MKRIKQEYSYKKRIFCGKNIKARSSKRMDNYYDSAQFERDVVECSTKAEDYRNDKELQKTLQDINHSTPKVSSKDFKILIVDDNQEVRNMLQNFLKEGCGFVDIDVAVNGKEALNMIKYKKYDLVLSDFNMPEMNGYYLWKNIQELNIETTFVLISGYDDTQFKHLKRAGVFCLPKLNCMKLLEKIVVGYYIKKINNKLKESL